MKSDKTRKATDLHIDNIIKDVTKVSMKDVVNHLKEFGLTTKPPEDLEGGAASGLNLKKRKKQQTGVRKGQ